MLWATGTGPVVWSFVLIWLWVSLCFMFAVRCILQRLRFCLRSCFVSLVVWISLRIQMKPVLHSSFSCDARVCSSGLFVGWQSVVEWDHSLLLWLNFSHLVDYRSGTTKSTSVSKHSSFPSGRKSLPWGVCFCSRKQSGIVCKLAIFPPLPKPWEIFLDSSPWDHCGVPGGKVHEGVAP